MIGGNGRGWAPSSLKRLVQVGRQERLERIRATMLKENHGMQRVAKAVGFALTRPAQDADFSAEIIL